MVSYAEIIQDLPKDIQLPMMKLMYTLKDELHMRAHGRDPGNMVEEYNEIIQEFPINVQEVMVKFLDLLREEMFKAIAER